MEVGDFVPPMLGVTAPKPFSRSGWWFETKWDGYRAIISVGREFRVYSRRGHDLTRWYPSIRSARQVLPEDIVLDAELVAWVDGRPAFSELQQKTATQYVLMVFDCLYVQGRWLMQEPLAKRQAQLRRHVQTCGVIVVPDGMEQDGEALFAAIREARLEGVMAKRLDSPYLPGRRSASWQKFLAYRVDWFWVFAVSAAADGTWYWRIGETQDGRMRAVGKVHAPRSWRPAAQTVEPFLAEVQYRERTREGHLRHARLRQWRSHTENSPP